VTGRTRKGRTREGRKRLEVGDERVSERCVTGSDRCKI